MSEFATSGKAGEEAGEAPSSSSSSSSFPASNVVGEEEVVEEVYSNSVSSREFEEQLQSALARKAEGNEYFKEKEYDLAVERYSQAIEMCPDNEENKENLAIFFGNRAACYATMGENDLAAEDCSKSLELKPDYVKVLMRRCQVYEKLEKLEEALADAKKVKEMDPNYPKISNLINRLDAANKEKMEKLKDEALGKLKELGNSILGNFGMSLDNFKMQQDPNTGSYSISMGNPGDGGSS